MERVNGIEPSFEAWEAPVLPLNYTRGRQQPVSLQPAVVGSHHYSSLIRPSNAPPTCANLN